MTSISSRCVAFDFLLAHPFNTSYPFFLRFPRRNDFLHIYAYEHIILLLISFHQPSRLRSFLSHPAQYHFYIVLSIFHHASYAVLPSRSFPFAIRESRCFAFAFVSLFVSFFFFSYFVFFPIHSTCVSSFILCVCVFVSCVFPLFFFT